MSMHKVEAVEVIQAVSHIPDPVFRQLVSAACVEVQTWPAWKRQMEPPRAREHREDGE
jgi:hypothetical protein